MALTSTTDSLSTTPIPATPNTPGTIRQHAIWLAALAVWFWHEFEVPVAGRHLLAIIAGVGTLLAVLFVSTLLLAVTR